MKKTVILAAVLAALVVFSLVYKGQRDQRINSARLVGAENREFLLPNLAVGDIRKIRVSEGEAQVNLVVDGNRWIVQERSGYTASIDAIKRAVESLTELKIIGKDVVEPPVFEELQLLPPAKGTAPEKSGLFVELMDEKGELLASFVAGVSTQTSGGISSSNPMMGGASEQRYVRTFKDENTVWLVNDPLAEWQVDPKQWIDKAFFSVKNIKSIAVTAPVPADSWAAERKDLESPFILIGGNSGEELDTAKTSRLPTLLDNTTFTDVLPKEQVKDDFFNGAITAKLVTFDGFTYDVKLKVVKEGQGEESIDHCFFTFNVSGSFPSTRTVAADEKPEDKAKNDESFAADLKARQAKLDREKSLAGWVFETASYNVDTLQMKRVDVLRDKDPSPAADGTPQPSGPPIQLPGLTPPPVAP